MTLIAIGFAKLMDRAVNVARNNQQASAAAYAAQSALNDTMEYLNAHPSVSVTKCNDPSLSSVYDAGNLSGDGRTKYSCILLDATPTEIDYLQKQGNKSQILKINI